MGLGRVEVTGGFLLLLAWLNYLDRSFLVPMAVLACGVHELGHLLAIRLLGGTVREIRLTAIGAELVLSGPLGYWQEGAAALAGPGVNLLLALLMILCASVIAKAAPANVVTKWVFYFLLDAAALSVGLGLFNLIPIPPLDGSKVLFALLPERAYLTLMRYERYGMLVLLLLVWMDVGGFYLSGAIGVIYRWMIGLFF